MSARAIQISGNDLGLAYRDSDYTAVIATMHLSECKKLVLKLTLVEEI